MAFCLESLLSAYQKRYHLCIVAGENGVCNPVTWVYLAEDIENIPMLKDNQLVITTGLFTRNGTTLMEFLSAIIAQNEAGIILNIGKYLNIEDITEEVRNFCTAHHFPFYTMPWEVPLTDVMQSFCAELLKHSQTHSLISTAFRNTLMHLENPEKEEAVLEQNGFKREDVYTIIAISGSFSDHGIDRLLHHKKMNFHIFLYHKATLVVLTGASRQSLSALSESFSQLEELQSCIIGISSQGKGRTMLSKLYQQAEHALRAAEIQEEQMVWYDEMGILALIFAVPDRQLLEQLAQNKLQVFEAYDEKHHACLVETLFYYLRTGGSLSATAEKLYTHRNTIGYRMNKIRELSGKTFASQEERCDYLTAIYIRKALLY